MLFIRYYEHEKQPGEDIFSFLKRKLYNVMRMNYATDSSAQRRLLDPRTVPAQMQLTDEGRQYLMDCLQGGDSNPVHIPGWDFDAMNDQLRASKADAQAGNRRRIALSR